MRLLCAISWGWTGYRHSQGAPPHTALRWIFKRGCGAHPKPDPELPGGVSPRHCATAGLHLDSTSPQHCGDTTLTVTKQPLWDTPYAYSLSYLQQCLVNLFGRMVNETLPSSSRARASSLQPLTSDSPWHTLSASQGRHRLKAPGATELVSVCPAMPVTPLLTIFSFNPTTPIDGEAISERRVTSCCLLKIAKHGGKT